VPLRPPDIHAHRILILDFGAQYTQLIARRVRESGVYCEILPWDADSAEVRAFGARGIILSGGPESVTDSRPPAAPPVVFELGVPVLGICYGMQTMAQQLGGRVTPSGHREFGYAQVTVTAPCRLLEGLRDHDDPQGRSVLDVWMSHGDRVDALPPGFVPVGASANAPFAAMADESRCFYAVQFHPEVTHTLQGARIIERFVREICAARPVGSPGTSSPTRWRGCASRWAMTVSCSGCPAASIRPWWRRCSTVRSVTNSCACSSTTVCCAPPRATRS
jgi:GMP synthase (glutamine-hydrolysing)